MDSHATILFISDKVISKWFNVKYIQVHNLASYTSDIWIKIIYIDNNFNVDISFNAHGAFLE